MLELEDMGFDIEASHHEVAPGQHEIDFKYADAITACDNIQTFKLVVKTIARKHNLHATFMPKPLFGVNGSGMHFNVSLFKGKENAFFDPNGEMQLKMRSMTIRIEKEVNILYKYIIFNFVYRKYNKKKIIEYFFSFPI